MREFLRKLSFLLCFVALLSLTALPLFADPVGSDHPWDDASNNDGSTEPGSDPNQGGSDDQALTGYNVYLGFEGLFNLLTDSFAYYYRVILTGGSKDGKVVKPEFKGFTSTQSKG